MGELSGVQVMNMCLPDGTMQAAASYRLRRDPQVSDQVKTAVFLLGIVVLVGLLLAIWITAIRPFFKACYLTISS